MQKFKFSYDKENDDLFLFNPKSRSQDSVLAGDIVIDYDSKKNIVGLQLMNASNLITKILNGNIADVRSILNNITDTKVNINKVNKMLIIEINLYNNNKGIFPLISLPLDYQDNMTIAQT